MRWLIAVVVTALVLGLGVPASAAGEVDVAALGLAKDRGISISEAQERLDWQVAAPDLAVTLAARLGSKFGGLWIAPDDGDRIKVGVTTPADQRSIDTALSAADAAGVGSAVDVVVVRHSQAELDAANDWLGEELTRVNTGAASPLRAGIRTNLNLVALDQPIGGTLTASQLDLLAAATIRYRDLVQVGTYTGRSEALASCLFIWCQPPLRAGIQIFSNQKTCTGGFIGQSNFDGTFVQFSAGHCWTFGETPWQTMFPSDGSVHTVGPAFSILSDKDFDVFVIKVNNPAGWSLPSATVRVTASDDTTENLSYVIHSDNLSVVGMRICTTGEKSIFSDCGEVDELGVTDTYDGTTHHHLGIADDICAHPGDSGAPMYANHVAFGVLVAGSGCEIAYESIRTAELKFNVHVLHG